MNVKIILLLSLLTYYKCHPRVVAPSPAPAPGPPPALAPAPVPLPRADAEGLKPGPVAQGTQVEYHKHETQDEWKPYMQQLVSSLVGEFLSFLEDIWLKKKNPPASSASSSSSDFTPHQITILKYLVQAVDSVPKDFQEFILKAQFG